MCHRAKFYQNQPNAFGDISIFLFSRWPPSAILDFEIFKFLVYHHIGWPNMHRRTNIHPNRSNGCWYIAFNNFQNGGRPPSWIFKSLLFWSAGNLWRNNMCRHAKFRQNQPNGFWDIVIFWFSRWPPSAILDFEIFQFLVSRQVGRAKMHHPTIKIGRTAAEISYLTFSKMAAVSHLGFFKIDFFEHFLGFGGLMCVSMQNFLEIGRTVAEI